MQATESGPAAQITMPNGAGTVATVEIDGEWAWAAAATSLRSSAHAPVIVLNADNGRLRPSHQSRAVPIYPEISTSTPARKPSPV
jgi:hypothetical protein